ncbi:Double-stranded RNA-binding protein 2-like [Heracleum sosnowskyi]|uniref:Double-stranded RNA-binding protein 2-like n=1 Tax=Heracleum sosnowskyi TaxID=360622 RepID=A0AAD8HVM9_9APIA|nr:Double-stranded RNA-binding protein 2-like [Heracleum sosnowskyi]
MAATYNSDCYDDDWIPVRATYENLYKWPGSDAEFVRSVSSNGRWTDTNPHPSTRPFTRSFTTNGRLDGASQPRVVDSMSCRQIYLRSYTFSRKESMPEKAKKCASRIKRSVSVRGLDRKVSGRAHGSVVVIRRAKEISCTAMNGFFRRLLSCTTKVDVVG